MNADTFAEWLRRQGHKVFRSESSYWYDAGLRVLQAFPYHWVINPSDVEIFDLLKRENLVALRYSTPLQAAEGLVSYHVIYDGPTYTLDSLERRSRQNVRSGLKNCRIEPITLERLAEDGWLLEADTTARQGRARAAKKDAWRMRLLAAVGLPGFEAWGALVGDRLVASILSFQMEDCCELISQQCHREFLSARVNNALIFQITQNLVNRPMNHLIFYTIQSLDAPASVDEFKFRMGYRAFPVRQRVVFHPLLAPMITASSKTLVDKIAQRLPHNPNLPKVQGILRFYLEGRLPIAKQNLPECLIDPVQVLNEEHL